MDHRKKTYPVLVAHAQATEAERQFIQSYYQARHVHPAMTQELLAILERTSARQRTINLGLGYLEQAQSLIAAINGTVAVKVLISEWIRGVTERQLGTL